MVQEIAMRAHLRALDRESKEGGINLFFDPVRTMLEAVNEAFPVGNYPGFRAQVQFAPILTRSGNLKRVKGMIQIPEYPVNPWPRCKTVAKWCPSPGAQIPIVTININVHIGMVPDVLAHELAHLLSWPNKDHGREFKKNYNLIRKAYEDKMSIRPPAGGSVHELEVCFRGGRVRVREVKSKRKNK